MRSPTLEPVVEIVPLNPEPAKSKIATTESAKPKPLKGKKQFTKQQDLQIPKNVQNMMSQFRDPFREMQNLMSSEAQITEQIHDEDAELAKQRFSLKL